MTTRIPKSVIEPVFADGSDKPSHYVINDPDLVLLDTDEAAIIMNTTSSAIKEWRRDGVIPYVRIKGRISYRLSDILKTIDAHTFRNDPTLPTKL